MYKKGCIKLTVTVETYDMSLHENSCNPANSKEIVANAM